MFSRSDFGSLIAFRSFYIQCPLAILAIILVVWKLDSPGSSLPSHHDKPRRSKLRRVDFLGCFTLAAAITGFLLALDLGGQRISWTHPIVWILFASSAIFGVFFLLAEAYIAQEPIFPLRLLFHRDVLTTYLVTGLQSGSQFAVISCPSMTPRAKFTDNLGDVFRPSILSDHDTKLSDLRWGSFVPRGIWERHWRSDEWFLYQEVDLSTLNRCVEN